MSCNLNTGKEVNFSPFPHFEVTKFKTQQWYMVLEKKWPPKGNLMQKKKNYLHQPEQSRNDFQFSPTGGFQTKKEWGSMKNPI